MRATLLHIGNAFDPRQRRALEVRRRTRVRTLIARHSLALDQPTIGLVNGAPRWRKDWLGHVLRDGDVVVLVTRPQGGGQASNPLQAVLMIAAMAVAGPSGAALAGTLGLSGMGATLFRFGASMALGALANTLVQPPRPPAPHVSAQLAAPSPTYSTQFQGNSGRLDQAIPELFGEHIIFPDFGAEPYREYVGDDEYAYALYVVGRGHYEIPPGTMRFDDTPLAHLGSDVATQIVGPQGTVTLFPVAVTTAPEVAGLDLPPQQTVPTSGGFVVNASGTQIHRLAFDVLTPRGLYRIDASGALQAMAVTLRFDVQAIDDAGAPLEAWHSLGVETISAATTTPQRRSYGYDLARGRYQARVLRVDAKDTSAQAGHDVSWIGLRGYVPAPQSFGDVTVIALRARASQVTGQALRRFNVIARRRLHTWSSAAGWSPQPVATRSPAWAAVHILREIGEPDSRINLAAFEALAATLAARDDTFDGVFDQQQEAWDALRAVLRAGRAVPYRQAGITHVFRDQPGAPTMQFSMRNIVRNSFAWRFVIPTEETSDAVRMEWTDRLSARPMPPVVCALPGSDASQPARVQAFGFGSRAQVAREGYYAAANNLYRRMLCTFDTELEGHVPSYGDLVIVQHQLLDDAVAGDVLGYFGDLAGGLPVGAVLRLSQDIAFGPGDRYIGLRDRRGMWRGPWRVISGPSPDTVVLAEAITGFLPRIGGDAEQTHFVCGAGVAFVERARVRSTTPRGRTVEVQVVIDDERVHSADSTQPPPPPAPSTLPSVPARPALAGLALVNDGTPDAPVVKLSWAAAVGAHYYAIDTSPNGADWERAGDTSALSYSLPAPAGGVWIGVSPVGLLRGDRVVVQVSGAGRWEPQPVALSGLVATPTMLGAVLTWDQGGYQYADRTEVLRSSDPDPGGAALIATIRGPVGVYYDALGAPNLTRHYWVRQVDRRARPGPLSNRASVTTGRVMDAVPGTGTIAMQMFAADFVYSGFLAANTVRAGNIEANAVTGREIAADSITAARGQIADLTVGTLKIQENAVTVAVSAFSAGPIALLAGDTWLVLQQVTAATSGAPVEVLVQAHADGWGGEFSTPRYRLRRGPDTLIAWPQSELKQLLVWRDWPPAGVHTYRFEFSGNHDLPGASATNRLVRALEVKR